MIGNNMDDIKIDNPEKEPVVEKPSMTKDELTNIVITHRKEIKELMDDISMISSFIKRIPKKRVNSFFKFFTDKEYVIVGVVIIAIVSMFVLTDPTTIISSIVSGLFGIGTGRAISSKDDD